MVTKFNTWLIQVDEDKIIRRTTFWNLITSLINAGYSAILMFMIGRFVGMNDVGIFSLASAYAYQCQTIGAFGVRNVQASDVRKDFSFSDYFYLRILSTIIMLSLLFYYSFLQGYDSNKVLIILIFGIFKGIDAVEDLFHGEYHRYNRLDIGSILQAFRFLLTLILFSVILIITQNLISSLLISTIFSILICIVQNASIIRKFVCEKLLFNGLKFRKLLLVCLPICASNYISTYIVNLPKYTIDVLSYDNMQAIYGVLILPVVTINMLSVVIYRPIINRMSQDYYNKKFKDFFREIGKQLTIIMVLTIIITISGGIIGLRILEIIYNMSLHSNMLPFIIMLLGGGANTIVAFFTVILTIQRCQNLLLGIYVFTALLGIVISKPLIIEFGMIGTALLYLCLSLCMVILSVILIYAGYLRERKI